MPDLANPSVAEQRLAWRAARSRLLQCRETEMAALQEDVDREARELEAARAIVTKAEAACAAAQLVKMDRSTCIDRELADVEAALRRTADPALAAFVEQELPALERTLRSRDALSVTEGYRDQRTTAWVPGISTMPSIERRLTAIRQARVEADALMLEQLTSADVLARLKALRATITSIPLEYE